MRKKFRKILNFNMNGLMIIYNSYILEQSSYCPFSCTYSIDEMGRVVFHLNDTILEHYFCYI